jgi:hypothetical protein
VPAAGVSAKLGGTYICMEGPQFSTKAESNVYRSWGADVIGMTNLQEAKLAREAEICYVTIAMVTDYDCWHPHHDSVTVEQIVSVLVKNAENAAKVVKPRWQRCRRMRAASVDGAGACHSHRSGEDSGGHKRETAIDIGKVLEIVGGRVESLVSRY